MPKKKKKIKHTHNEKERSHPRFHLPSTLTQQKLPYDFAYGVADHYTGADFGHTETSDGNAVKGSYHVLLPDGRKQIVTYTADHYNGFQAHVSPCRS